MNYRAFILPAILLTVAGQLLRAANENYELIRDDYGIGWVLGMAGLALLFLLIALKLFTKAFKSK